MSAKDVLADTRGLIEASCRYTASEVFAYVIWHHHEAILRHFEQHQATLDLAPPGCGKSRIATIAYAFWRAIKDPNIRILIVSDTDAHAVNFLSTIKTALEYSPIVIEHWGDVKGPRWSDHYVTLKGRTKILSEPTLSALGATSGAVTSGHYDIIICDDLVNFDNARTEGKRSRMIDWFRQTLLPTLIPGGEIHIVGTRYHYLDLYQTVMDEYGYDTQIQAAIQVGPDGEDVSIWEDYMPLHDRRDPVTGKETEGLLTIRANSGSMAFSLQYQNDVELMKKGEIFHLDWFRWYSFEERDAGPVLLLDDDTEIPLSDLIIYQGVDPAIGEKEVNDYFVIATVGHHRKTDQYFLLDVFRNRPTYQGRADAIKAQYDKWGPRILGIENVAFQKEFCQRIRATFPYIRLQEIHPGSTDKVTRAWSRSGLVENGRVHIRRGMTLLVDELCMMPEGEHDDMFDAWDMALQIAGVPRSGMKWTSIGKRDKYARTTQEDDMKPKTLYKGTRRDRSGNRGSRWHEL